ncbi:hypothetical protein B9Z55_025860 [Caenorhabditis nigoni]|uniref:glycogenin glucosyltransferase n=1 Tax=Caenorhabditis nigoni TaxID=1611254 RepID=A0A2G5T0X2_9PELO|nr:hypothetical protein B9Z55_025860 [Caenorhabditis nigoni]
MNAFIVGLLLLFIFPEQVTPQKYAYVSVLSSNDFLLPAKVLAYRLKKLNASIPYIIIVTQDITEKSVNELKEQGVIVHNDTKIDTPYIKTHKARKYQYTKIRLWAMTEFDVIVHLDLDVLPTRDISTLFECGSFCAVFRHSDMFNSGVFVLKTNETVFHDMVQHVQTAESYDGGDQGFLNTYFHDLKYAPMHDPSGKQPKCANFTMARLSAKFNYDIGMYYLNNGRFLVDPDIIHYTMGPTKPWLWWTYPLFDLNWMWLDARQEMEFGSSNEFDSCIILAVTNFSLISLLIIAKVVLERHVHNIQTDSVSNLETHLVSQGIYMFSVWLALKLAHQSAQPIAAWVFFASNVAWTASILTSIYTHLRSGVDVKVKPVLSCVFFTMLSYALSWLILVQIAHFNTRVLFAIVSILAQQILVVTYIRYALIIRPCRQQHHKYQILPNNHHVA